MATGEASDGALPPRSTAASGRLVLPASDRTLSLLGSLGWAGAAPKAPRGQQRHGYMDRTSERSRHLVGARVVWGAKRDEKLGMRRPFILFKAP